MNMRLESNRQELAGRLVEREVYYCVSSLISTLSDMAQHDSRGYREREIDWEDDILPLLESIDYERAGTDAIERADLSDLETMCESVGYWNDTLEALGYEPEVHYAEEIEEINDRINQINGLDHVSLDDEVALIKLRERLEALEDEPLETWLNEPGVQLRTKGDDARRDQLNAAVVALVSDWPEFCRDNDVDDFDDYRDEVYEHWLVSGWLARKLKERGYVTGELCGLTIWGRCCTGQSIALDYVIQQIACELWPEDVLKEETA